MPANPPTMKELAIPFHNVLAREQYPLPLVGQYKKELVMQA